LVRGKKPWAVAAAGILLVGLGAAALGNYLDEAPYTAPGLNSAMERSKKAADAVAQGKRDFDKAKGDAIAEEAAVAAIVAGQSERLNWMHLTRFVSDVVPRPDGSNLSDAARKKYFLGKTATSTPNVLVMSGKEAWASYQSRIKDAGKIKEEDK